MLSAALGCLVAAGIPAASGQPKAAGDATRPSARIFWSGHSLTDQPIPDYVAEVAKSLGNVVQWNRQYVVGSSIHTRTRGRNSGDSGWAGYSQGYNRSGQGMDVIGELRRPQTVSGRYDTLIITEQHWLLGTLLERDTVRLLRHYHDRLIDGNPKAVTYFYESWLGLDDKNDPRRWIAYERAASPIWQCIVTRINRSLEAEGRQDRILSLPAGVALAALIERATQGSGLEDVSGTSTRETVDRLIADSVHLTSMGKYYMALITYSVIFRQPSLGAWAPEGVSAAQAKTLQTVAWQFVGDYYKSNKALELAQCRTTILDSFAGLFWNYIRDTSWKANIGMIRSEYRTLKNIALARYRLWRENAENPFHYAPSTDRDYWHRAP